MLFLHMEHIQHQSLPWRVSLQLIYGVMGMKDDSLTNSLTGLSESLHRELAPFNVSVLIVEPGLFQTNFFRGLTNTKPLSSVYQNTPVAHVFQRITSNSAHNQQLGDPRKAARAIFNAVAGQPSERLIGKVLRLPLGSDANSMIEQKIENLKADNWKTREIAKSTDRDVS